MAPQTRSSGRPRPASRKLPRQVVDDHARGRCALALAEVVHEVGRKGLTVALIIARAKMARSTFYSLFAGQQEAFEYGCRLSDRMLADAVEGAVAGAESRQEQLEAAFAALIAAVERAPYLAELSLVHGGGSYDRELLGALAGLLEPAESGWTLERGPFTGELLASGALFLIADRLRRGDLKSLADLAPELATLTSCTP